MRDGLSIAPEVFARLPGLRVVVVVAHGVACANPQAVDEIWSGLKLVVRKALR